MKESSTSQRVAFAWPWSVEVLDVFLASCESFTALMPFIIVFTYIGTGLLRVYYILYLVTVVVRGCKSCQILHVKILHLRYVTKRVGVI